MKEILKGQVGAALFLKLKIQSLTILSKMPPTFSKILT
jgi:hypothetical protein